MQLHQSLTVWQQSAAGNGLYDVCLSLEHSTGEEEVYGSQEKKFKLAILLSQKMGVTQQIEQ